MERSGSDFCEDSLLVGSFDRPIGVGKASEESNGTNLMCPSVGSRVSVVIPVRNRPIRIMDALQSVQAQTYKNWEVIVVDDGSTDNTAEVVEDCTRQESRIRLLQHKCKRGAQAARNSGIRAASGEWIAFLDSDDRWFPNSLELRLRVAERENVSVVHSGSMIMEANGTIKPYRLDELSGRIYRYLLTHEGPMYQSLLVRKVALESIGLLDERIRSFQEWDTSIRLAKFYRFGFEPSPTFIYNLRNPDPVSISRDALGQAIGFEQVFQKHFMAILRYSGLEALSRDYWFAGSLYKEAGALSIARRRFLMSWILKCLSPRIVVRKLRRILS